MERTLGLQLCSVLPTLPWTPSPLSHSVLLLCWGLGTQVPDILCSMPTVCLLHLLHSAAHSLPVGLRVPTAEPWNSRVSGDCSGVWKGVVISRCTHLNIPLDSLLTRRGTAGRGHIRAEFSKVQGQGRGPTCPFLRAKKGP